MASRKISTLAQLTVFATELAATLKGGEMLLLSGELGSGKTAFTQGLARALGVTEPITSPTFTIIGEYPVTQHLTIKKLVHADLYRLTDEQVQHESAVRQLLEMVNSPDRLTVIEWAEKLGDRAPNNARWLRFRHGATENERILEIE